MGLFKRGGPHASPVTIPFLLILFLVAYLLGNMGMHAFRSRKDDNGTLMKGLHTSEKPDKTKTLDNEEGCDSIAAYIEDGRDETLSKEDPWRQMKWGLPPAKCRVNGHLIEKLDPLNNYRRGVALGFTEDLDDKTHIEHWFLGTKVDLNKRKRRVFIDLGANYFATSLLWFQQRYPCDFTEVHAFEVDPQMLRLPNGFEEESNRLDPNVPSWKKVKGREGYIPQWMVNRIHAYNKFAGDVDDEEGNSVNITRFMKNELNLTKDDTVIVKMDIEGSEWPILERWVNDPEMPRIIDELWVELHYYHPDNNWITVKEHSRDDATRMLAEHAMVMQHLFWD